MTQQFVEPDGQGGYYLDVAEEDLAVHDLWTILSSQGLIFTLKAIIKYYV